MKLLQNEGFKVSKIVFNALLVRVGLHGSIVNGFTETYRLILKRAYTGAEIHKLLI